MTMLLALLAAAAAPQDWPTHHRDPQRSGFSDEVVRGPYERKWFRDFHDEMIASRAEAVVAEGKCFVGTFAGTLYALRVEDGSTAWTFKAGAPIGHSALYSAGKVYFGADDGKLHCLRASDGGPVWAYDAGAGIWVAPAGDGERVYFGDRAGTFHAVSAETGAPAWRFRTGGMILKPASLSEDGRRIVVGSEDMHVYGLDPEGRLLWKSKKLQGLSQRDQAPAVWRGLALVRTSPADGFHTVMDRNQDVLVRAQTAIPLGPRDKVINDKHGAYILRPTPEREKAEREAVLRYLRENPHDQTFYALRLEDGTEPWVAPVFYTGGLHNPPTPPTFHPKTGDCYTFYRTSLTNYSRGVRPFTGLGRLDRDTGLVENLWHAQGDDIGWSDFATIGDETESLSLMGDVLLSTHQGTIGGLNVGTRKWHPIYNGRDTYGGVFGPGALPGGWEAEKKMQREGFLVNMPNEWHGPDRSILAVASKRLFWVVGSQVVCWGGPDTPRADTGGTKPPPPRKKKFSRVVAAGGNVTADRVGEVDPNVARRAIGSADLERFLEPPPSPAPSDAPLAKALRAKLEAAVLELVEGGPWAPFIVELGISREERHFWKTAETRTTLALALPHLSAPVREKARTFLDRLFEGRDLHDERDAKRRELYDLGPGMKRFAAAGPSAAPPEGIELYSRWAYAHYADRWDKLLPKAATWKAGAVPLPDPRAKERARELNSAMAGSLALARLLRKAGRSEEVGRAVANLEHLATERVHLERADTAFVRAVRDPHSASIPRYVDLVPEVAAILAAFAGDELRRNLSDLMTQLPVWYQAFAERMIGGENYTHTPHLARGLFLAWADGARARPEDLAARLDQPWCRADLYFIEKVTAVLRTLDGAR
jgi:outer membrane protein assembly factor BamB